MTKMRLLTFMQLAEGSSEMSFDTITSELLISEDQVEEFIIDGNVLTVFNYSTFLVGIFYQVHFLYRIKILVYQIVVKILLY